MVLSKTPVLNTRNKETPKHRNTDTISIKCTAREMLTEPQDVRDGKLINNDSEKLLNPSND